MQMKWLLTIVTSTAILALFVVMLGAYTRLSDAGLGCPDWPGCYGKLVMPVAGNDLDTLQHHYPNTPIEVNKAWTEMAHRYVAGLLASLIVLINLWVLNLRQYKSQPIGFLPLVLLLLVILQAMLGMWTVTLKLLPIVVMGHLLGGMLIFANLVRLRMQLSYIPLSLNYSKINPNNSKIPILSYSSKRHRLILVGVIIVFFQIALGGWVSANYAGIACIGFPRCNGQWLPALHFTQGFNLLSPIGSHLTVNYQGGVLDSNARASIAFIHRIGAIITASYVILLSFALLKNACDKALKITALITLVLVSTQFILGVLNVLYLLPIEIAVAHNGVAALLLATMQVMLYLAQRGRYAH
jgi:cytochrome c oxidase assembly protein subunit 15